VVERLFGGDALRWFPLADGIACLVPTPLARLGDRRPMAAADAVLFRQSRRNVDAVTAAFIVGSSIPNDQVNRRAAIDVGQIGDMCRRGPVERKVRSPNRFPRFPHAEAKRRQTTRE
jgi:hypothetical protein